MGMRQRNKKQGSLNGTRVINTRLLDYQVIAKIIASGSHKENKVLIPGIGLFSNLKPGYKRERTQILLRLSYAITISKSQCQTLTKTEILLMEEKQSIAQAQLYVAIS